MLTKYEDLKVKTDNPELAFDYGMAAAFMCLTADWQAATTDDMNYEQAVDILDNMLDGFYRELEQRIQGIPDCEKWLKKEMEKE
jgi:hypothetical protein